MVEVTNRMFEVVHRIFLKLGQTTIASPRWQIAMRVAALEIPAKCLVEGKREPESVRHLMEERRKLYEKYGVLLEDGASKRYSIPKDRQEELVSEILRLELENPDLVKEESSYRKAIEDLYEEMVHLDIEPIDYEWCGDLITANEVAILFGLGLIRDPIEK